MNPIATKYTWFRPALSALLLWIPSLAMAGATMTGTVKNASTGAPVGQAAIALYGWKSATNKEYLFDSVRTDAQGKYKFDSLPANGSGVVNVTREGFKTFHQVLLYPLSGNTTWNYEIQPTSTALENPLAAAKGNRFTARQRAAGKILLRVPAGSKDARVRSYLPTGELVFEEAVPAPE